MSVAEQLENMAVGCLALMRNCPDVNERKVLEQTACAYEHAAKLVRGDPPEPGANPYAGALDDLDD